MLYNYPILAVLNREIIKHNDIFNLLALN
jgi:hypothetical protein